MELLQTLQQIETFREVPAGQLTWLIEQGEIIHISQGEILFDQGGPMDHMLIVLEGRFVMKRSQKPHFRVVGYFETLEIGGLLPYSRAKEAGIRAEALTDATLLQLHKSHFREMIHQHEALTTSLVHTMSTRIRRFTKLQQQNDKMMALGKLSAGLMHELNNPAAAVVRSAQELKKHLGFLPEGFKSVIRIQTTEQEVDLINHMLFSKIESDGQAALSMMEKAELEDEILDWLEDHEIEEGEEIAEILAEFNLGIEDLEMVRDNLRAEDLYPVINWLSQVLTTEKFVTEIEEASQRIGNLVGSVKSYSHMDRAPEKQATDIHIGLRNTLTLLGHKLKRHQIQVIEHFDPNLPQPEVYVSELNQVWTNLIDNAIDAMKDGEERQLTLATGVDPNCVFVNIEDTGAGIPPEVQEKIFDPFFTTKAVGEGTGLGLDTVQQIIAKHNATIHLQSQPGKTVFHICLPLT